MKFGLSKRKVGLTGLLLLLMLVLVPAAVALEWRDDEVVTIEAGEVIDDDLYVGANELIMNGTVNGDLIVGGNTITINGTVEGDLLAGGQSIVINGTVGDDVRAAGAALELGAEANVADDLLFAGYSLETNGGSAIGGELAFAGFQASLNGDIEGDVFVGSNSLAIHGRIGGDVTAEVGTEQEAPPFDPFAFTPDAPDVPNVPGGLTIGDDANIEGTLSYRAPSDIEILEENVGGNIDFERIEVETRPERSPVVETLINSVQRLIATLLIGGLLIWRAPAFMNTLNRSLQENPLPSLGWGALAYFGWPVLMLIVLLGMIVLAVLFGTVGLGNLTAAVIWGSLALIFAATVAFSLILVYPAKIIVSVVMGRWLLTRINPAFADRYLWPFVVGLIILVLLLAIPYLGALMNLLLSILGVGAIWLWWRERSKNTLPKAT